MKLLVHVEQYDVVGILPSQLEHILLLAAAMGVSEIACIDGTPDGFAKVGQVKRYASMADFLAEATGQLIAFGPGAGEDVRDLVPDPDAWLMFGPAMGWTIDAFDGHQVTWANVPGGVMTSRDVVPIALWETSAWRAQ